MARWITGLVDSGMERSSSSWGLVHLPLVSGVLSWRLQGRELYHDGLVRIAEKGIGSDPESSVVPDGGDVVAFTLDCVVSSWNRCCIISDLRWRPLSR